MVTGTLRSVLHAGLEVNTSVIEVPDMAGIQFVASGALKKAAGVKSLLDTGLVRLFTDDLVPTSATLKADFEASEADFKGYAAAVEDWTAPLLESGGGGTIRFFNQFAYDSGAIGGSASNRIAGCWIEDADGDVWEYFVLPEVITVDADGTGVPLLLIDTEGAPSV